MILSIFFDLRASALKFLLVKETSFNDKILS